MMRWFEREVGEGGREGTLGYDYSIAIRERVRG